MNPARSRQMLADDQLRPQRNNVASSAASGWLRLNSCGGAAIVESRVTDRAYPYVLTVEFNLSISYGSERKSKTEAEGDTELSPSSVLIQLGADTSRNRNVYLVNKDGIRLKTRETLTKKFPGGTPGQWAERPTWANACWDWIGAQ